MPRPRRNTKKPMNLGNNRNANMRANGRNIGSFRGGLTPNQATPGTPPQSAQGCPPGQEPGIDPNTGAQICTPAQPNISGTVPVKNANRAIAPTQGKSPKQGY